MDVSWEIDNKINRDIYFSQIQMKNKRKFLKHISWIWVAIGFLSVLLIVFIVKNSNRNHNDVDYKPRACGGDWCFMVELARTQAEQEKGLMYRSSMEEQSGMLFIFPKSDFYDFRMKNTLIPLDMLWIDDQLNVVKIMTVPPCTADPCPVYKPEIFAKYVLEINAGMAEKHGIQEWTVMKFQNIR